MINRNNYRHIIDAFSQDIKLQTVTHAYMFEGGEENSRMQLAIEVACSLLCSKIDQVDANMNENSSFQESCNCDSCSKIRKGVHPDVTLCGNKLTESGAFPVDEARKIRKDAFMLPNEADYRIFIINNADKMNLQAQNALLKIFEEPPKNVIFILLCNFKNVFLPTTLSRMRIYKLKAITLESLSDEVSKTYSIQDEMISKSVAGYMLATSKSKLEKSEIELLKSAISLCEMFYLSTAECRILEYLPKKREDLVLTLDVLSIAARDLVVSKSNIYEGFIFTKTENIQKASTRFTTKELLSLYDIFSQESARLEKYANVNSVLAALSAIAK